MPAKIIVFRRAHITAATEGAHVRPQLTYIYIARTHKPAVNSLGATELWRGIKPRPNNVQLAN